MRKHTYFFFLLRKNIYIFGPIGPFGKYSMVTVMKVEWVVKQDVLRSPCAIRARVIVCDTNLALCTSDFIAKECFCSVYFQNHRGGTAFCVGGMEE